MDGTKIGSKITLLYWQVGNRIHTEILQGQRAEYGKQIIVSLSERLTQAYGKGWGEKQLRHCLRLVETFPDEEIVYTLCRELSWSHLRLFVYIDDPIKRDFYMEMTKLERSLRPPTSRTLQLDVVRAHRPLSQTR